MTRQVQQRIDLGNGQALGAYRDPHDLGPGFDLALVQDARIKAGSAVRHEQCSHSRLAQADTDPITGDARLRHFEQRATDPVVIADAHLVVGEPVNRKILSELPIGKVVTAELTLPIAIRVDLIDKDRAMLAAMASQVALTITVYVEPPD